MSNSKTSTLGDKTINRMGFGAMQLAGRGVFGPPRDPDAARSVLRRAIELGVDHIDTAQFYGPDVVNDLIRETLHPYPAGLKLVTKVGARRDDAGGWLAAASPAELRAAVEENLRSLRVERMDLVNLRLFGQGERASESDIPLADQIGVLAELRDEGKLDLIGISNVPLATIEEALALTPLGEVQNSFSILERDNEPEIDFCRREGIAFVPFFPLGSAFGDGHARLTSNPAVVDVATKHGATTSQIALAWLLAHYERTLLIPGTSSVAHLEENMAAGEIELDAGDLARLDAAREA